MSSEEKTLHAIGFSRDRISRTHEYLKRRLDGYGEASQEILCSLQQTTFLLDSLHARISKPVTETEAR